LTNAGAEAIIKTGVAEHTTVRQSRKHGKMFQTAGRFYASLRIITFPATMSVPVIFCHKLRYPSKIVKREKLKILNKLKFTFSDPDFEYEFRKDYIHKSIFSIRAGFILCIILTAVFGILDFWMVPETRILTWGIRFLISIPVLITVTVLSFYKLFHCCPR
jgi:hypothetical protein